MDEGMARAIADINNKLNLMNEKLEITFKSEQRYREYDKTENCKQIDAVENGVCELDVINNGDVAKIENALCELDRGGDIK